MELISNNQMNNAFININKYALSSPSSKQRPGLNMTYRTCKRAHRLRRIAPNRLDVSSAPWASWRFSWTKTEVFSEDSEPRDQIRTLSSWGQGLYSETWQKSNYQAPAPRNEAGRKENTTRLGGWWPQADAGYKMPWRHHKCFIRHDISRPFSAFHLDMQIPGL